MSEGVELTRTLVRMQSPNPGGSEAEIGCFIADWAGRLPGVEVSFGECLPGRPNVLARLRSGSQAPPLALVAHMDTVPAGDGWSVDPFAAELRDGMIYDAGLPT